MKNLLIIGTIIFVLTGCGGGGGGSSGTTPDTTNNTTTPETTTPTLAEYLRGEWIYVTDGTTVYIDDNFQYPITKVSDTLISIQKNNQTYHLMRNGIDSTNVSGDLYSDGSESVSRDLRSQLNRNIGSINVVLQHVTDQKNKKEIALNEATAFEFQNVKTGDYVLKATTDNNLSVSANVDIEGEEITLGSFKLVNNDGYNFKTEFVIDNSDSGFFYGNLKTYSGKLKIKNIGNKKGTGLNYSFATDSGYVSSFSNQIVLGTVDINKTIEIPFNISFHVLDKTKEVVPLKITIKDVNNYQWEDTVFFHVYQTPMNVKIKTKQSNVKGYIVAPGNKLTKIDTSDVTIKMPYREGKKYYLVLSNPTVNNETPYSVGIDTGTLSFETFQETAAHEPNNKESEATKLRVGDNIVSYLHEGDIDYFEIDMSSSTDVGLFSPPTMPFK